VVGTGSQSPAVDELSESRIFQDIGSDVSISGSPCIPEESQAGKATESEREDESKVLLVLETLNNRKGSILKYLSSTAKDAVSTPTDWQKEDPRLVDIQLASKRSTNEAKFRAGIARRSLADEYLLWEKEKYQTSRVDTLILDLASNNKKHVSEYVTSNSLFKGSKAARESILRGIKYRVFEKIYGSEGVSSFLIFANKQFRALQYRLLPLLAEKIKGSESWHGLADDKSKWMEECQALYEGQSHFGLQIPSLTIKQRELIGIHILKGLSLSHRPMSQGNDRGQQSPAMIPENPKQDQRASQLIATQIFHQSQILRRINLGSIPH
jgi:hypothetical protein